MLRCFDALFYEESHWYTKFLMTTFVLLMLFSKFTTYWYELKICFPPHYIIFPLFLDNDMAWNSHPVIPFLILDVPVSHPEPNCMLIKCSAKVLVCDIIGRETVKFQSYLNLTVSN